MTESNTADVSSPDGLVDAAYRFISFAAGGEPDWEAFRELFAPRSALALRVFPEDLQVRIMSLDEYVQVQVRDSMKVHGYTERPISRSIEVIGAVAQCRVEFEMNHGAGRIYRAIDLFNCAWVDGRWWIVSIISDVQSRHV